MSGQVPKIHGQAAPAYISNFLVDKRFQIFGDHFSEVNVKVNVFYQRGNHRPSITFLSWEVHSEIEQERLILFWQALSNNWAARGAQRVWPWGWTIDLAARVRARPANCLAGFHRLLTLSFFITRNWTKFGFSSESDWYEAKRSRRRLIRRRLIDTKAKRSIFWRKHVLASIGKIIFHRENALNLLASLGADEAHRLLRRQATTDAPKSGALWKFLSTVSWMNSWL